MSTLGDDEDDILAGLDFEVDEPTMVTWTELHPAERDHLDEVILSGRTIDLSTLDDVQLSSFHANIRRRLLDTHQMHAPPDRRTENGKLLHSAFTAANLETLRRRAT